MKKTLLPVITMMTMLFACSKTSDPVAINPKPLRVQFLHHDTGIPLPGLPISIDRAQWENYGRVSDWKFYGVIPTDQQGYIELHIEGLYKFNPISDTLWNPEPDMNPALFDTSHDKKCYLYRF